MATINKFLGLATGTALTGAVAFAPVAVAYTNAEALAVMSTDQVGSGGVSSPMAVFARHRWSDHGGNIAVSLDAPMSADQQLAYVRSVLGVSITDLAELLDVARPTVYAWMQGTEPRGEHLERLKHLEHKSREIEAQGIAGLGKLLKRPLSVGCTLLDAIKNDQPLGAVLVELASVARLEEQQRLSHKGSRLKMAASDVAREQSLPGYLSGS